MTISLDVAVRNGLNEIAQEVEADNFDRAYALASRLTKVSLFLEYRWGVYLGEYLEWIFENLEDIDILDDDPDSAVEKWAAFRVAFATWLNEAAQAFYGNEQKFLSGSVSAMVQFRYSATQLQADLSDLQF